MPPEIEVKVTMEVDDSLDGLFTEEASRGTTVHRGTVLLSDEELEEAAEMLRKAARK